MISQRHWKKGTALENLKSPFEPAIFANQISRYAWFLRGFVFVLCLLHLGAAPVDALRLTQVELLFEITGNLNAPSDVAVNADGRIYVVDGVNHAIRVFNAEGSPLTSFGTEGTEHGQLKFPLGIALDPSGMVYVADSGNRRIQIFDPHGNFIRAITLPYDPSRPHPPDPVDLAVDTSRNRCYVVDNDNHNILVYDLSRGKFTATFGEPGTAKLAFRYPFHIALDSRQALYIVDVINTRVQILNPNGRFVAYIGGWGVDRGEFFRPKGVAVDRNNKVYVSDSYTGVIQVFDDNGYFYSAIAQQGHAGVRMFDSPVSLFIDQENKLYVVEMFANRVGVYRIKEHGK